MPESQAHRARTRALVALAWLSVAVVITVVIFDVTRRARSMRITTAGAAFPPETQPGRAVKAVIRIESSDSGGRYLATVLAGIDDTTFRETRSQLEIEVTPETEVVMGSGADLKPSAVVQVAGTVEREHQVRAKRLVILTGYIRVTRG